MKRKLFSAILFGALLTASTSGLTSCKDYDDDISNLQSQIDKLATKEELATKASELSTAISNAQQAADAAKKVAEDAAAAAKGAASDADAAKKAAAAAQTAADNAQAAADAVAADLKKAVENAASQIQEAVKNLATKDEVTAAVKVVADKYDAQAKELKALSDRLDKVEAKLGLGEGGEDIDLTEIQAELEDIEDAFEALVGVVSNMVTSVELVPNATITGNNALKFTIVTEQKNDTFGKDVADKILTTAKGHTCFEGSEVVVRVNPADAEITADDIALINSKGEEISDLVKAVKVERYSNKNYLTRSTGNNTGLWKIKYAPVEGKTAAELAKKFSTDSYSTGATSTSNLILYAVSVKSAISDSIEANRRVVSDYDVTMQMSPATSYVAKVRGYASSANTTNITVNDEDIDDLRNRYNMVAGSGGTLSDYIWKDAAPAVAKANDNSNVVAGDKRGSAASPATKYLVARVGEDMTIKFTQKIKGFYVRLDYDFVETASAPSELNAWNSYKYVNVGTQSAAATMFEGQEGTIKVSALSGEATGDVIGFRIYAMNLDGTLVDPDGLAFYVKVGETGDDAVLDAQTVTVFKDLSGVASAASNGNITSALALPTDYLKVDVNNPITNVVWSASKGSDNYVPVNNTDFVVYYGTAANAVNGSTWNNAKFVAVQLKNPKMFVDDETYTFTGEVKKRIEPTNPSSEEYVVKTITVQVTKVMPTTPPLFVFNVEQAPEQVILPGDALDDLKLSSDGSAKEGKLDFNNMFIKSDNSAIKNDQNYIFSLASSWEKTNADGSKSDVARVRAWNKDVNANLADALGYKTTIAAKYIDCSTPHALTSSYNYGTITSKKNDDGSPANWVRETNSYSLTYYTWSYIGTGYMNYEWLKTADKDNSGKPTGTYTTHNTVTIETGTNTTTTFDLKNVAAKPGAKINTGIRKPDLDAYLADNWLKVDKITVEAKNAAGNVITNPYYTASASGSTAGTWKITFTRKNDIANVPAHEGTLKITVKDCYQKKSTIVLEGIKFVLQ